MKNQKKLLARIAALLLALVVCLTAVACGKKDDGKDESTSDGASEQAGASAGDETEAAADEDKSSEPASEKETTGARPTEKQTEKASANTEKPTEKKTEKVTEPKKTEPQTTMAEKKITEEDLEYLASELSFTLPDGTKIAPKVSAEGKKITVCYTTDNKKLLPGIQNISRYSSNTIFKMSRFSSVDSILFEVVGTDGKVIWSQEYKREA